MCALAQHRFELNPLFLGMTDCLGPVDPAHTENNGMNSKGPDSVCGPLCRLHHNEYDADREGFKKKYGISMQQVAAACWARYQSEVVSVSR